MEFFATAFDVAIVDAMLEVMEFSVLQATQLHGTFITLHVEEFPQICIALDLSQIL